MESIHWESILKGAISLGLSFASGWATGVLTDLSSEKAIATGVVAAATWYFGNRQAPVTLTKPEQK